MRGLPKFDDPNLLVGAEDFSDAGVYKLRDDLLIVQSLDFFPPLVDDPYLYGQIAAANSISDIYAMGATPTTALNIVGFPDDELDLEILHQILAGGAERVQQAGAVVAGGHTVRDVEIKFGLSVTGIVHPDHMLTNAGAQPGDVLVLTKPLGTGFVTTAFKKNKCPQDVLRAATDSMRSLNKSACEAARACAAHAATDITGFGLAGHAGELAKASNVTVRLELGKLPILPGARALARQGFHTRASASNRDFAAASMHLESGLDESTLEFIFDAQTSGGLLVSVLADKADEMVSRAQEGGSEYACVVGTVSASSETVLVIGA